MMEYKLAKFLQKVATSGFILKVKFFKISPNISKLDHSGHTESARSYK